MSAAEVRRLVPLAKRGDRAAVATLIASITPFVIQQAKKFADRMGAGRGSRFDAADRDDLIQVGLVAAVRSFDYFDPAWGGATWTTYASRAAVKMIHRHAEKELGRPRAAADADGCPVPEPGPPHPERTRQGWDVVRVRNALSRLDPTARELVNRVYGIDRPPEKSRAAAKALGINGWEARRLLKQALVALRTRLR